MRVSGSVSEIPTPDIFGRGGAEGRDRHAARAAETGKAQPCVSVYRHARHRKTSCAKILAKAVNCLDPQDGNPCNCCAACRAIDDGSCMDVLEIDAASNNGVGLGAHSARRRNLYAQRGQKRVYIIDEVHMLSIAAFNALLKIIEEPPEHLLFILATTELNKVPATILSRCQRFSFRKASTGGHRRQTQLHRLSGGHPD